MASPDDDLSVRSYTIPSAELEWNFGPSGGPGGQHANRSNTRAELRFDLAESEAFPADLKQQMLAKLGPHLVGEGTVVVSSDESRSQWRNRSLARKRLASLLEEAMRRPKRGRPTRPTRASKRRRVEQKRHRGEIKRLRKPPES